MEISNSNNRQKLDIQRAFNDIKSGYEEAAEGKLKNSDSLSSDSLSAALIERLEKMAGKTGDLKNNHNI